MSRLIFVPQYPVPMRYQEWWFEEFPKEFEKHFDEVIVLGKNMVKLPCGEDLARDLAMFSPIKSAIAFENFQIMEFMNMKTYPFDDVLFLSDLSFPGFFTNVLHHKKIKNSYAYCHATSINNLDYFENSRNSKWLIELGQSKMFKDIFVASNYHKNKLEGYSSNNSFNMSNVTKVGIPNPPFKTYQYGPAGKKIDIISVSRPTAQKVDLEIEEKVKREFGTDIVRKEFKKWDEYYQFVGSAKIMLISSREETYGYQVVDAILNGTIPLAPHKCSYPELLGLNYLYSNYNQLESMIINYLKNFNLVPKLNTQDEATNFYKTICERMKKG